jgi:hypothetical protein
LPGGSINRSSERFFYLNGSKRLLVVDALFHPFSRQ